MVRKVINEDDERIILYIVKDDINVSAIISELSTLGCKGEELGAAYRKLTSKDKFYLYEDKEAKTKLAVIDERSFDFDSCSFVPLIWAFFMQRMFYFPYKDFMEDLKKDGEVVK